LLKAYEESGTGWYKYLAAFHPVFSYLFQGNEVGLMITFDSFFKGKEACSFSYF